MKTFIGFLIGIFLIVFGVISLKAQDVTINIPENHIFNRTEFTTIQNVLNTQNHVNWRLGFFGPIDPTIRSNTGDFFSHQTLFGIKLPTDILQWQVESAGGKPAPFRSGDTWPLPYKWFTASNQTWYQPGSTTGGRTAGNISFNFKIPSDTYISNIYHAGRYSIGISHNYDSAGAYAINFTPNNFSIFLNVPATITWLTNTPTKYIEISSLTDYRSASGLITSDLGNFELGNTIDFNVWAKASSANIHFVPTKGNSRTINISNIKLGSAGSELSTKPLSANAENFSRVPFIVQVGNRNKFTPEISISAADFKTNFFEAGTYTLQLNFDAKSIDNSISRLQNTDVTLKVLPLSEITMPNTGQTVDFNFNTSAQYANGQSKVVPKQIRLSNNESFELYVKSDENYFKKGGVQTPINSNILQIGINGSSLMPLSTAAKQIISVGTPVLDKELDLKYEIPSAGAQTLVGYDKATYTINVIYSFIAL